MSLPWFLEYSGGLKTAVDIYTGAVHVPVLVVDFETTNRNHGWAGDASNDIVCASWLMASTAQPDLVRTYSQYGGIHEQNALVEDVRAVVAAPGLVIAHNAKFEAGWFERLGIDSGRVLWYDTMLAEYVMAGNRRWKLGLDAMAQRYGCAPKDPLIDLQMRNGVCPSLMAREDITARCSKDVRDTYKVFCDQRDAQTEAEAKLTFTRCLSVPVLADIEQQGIDVDGAAVEVEIMRAEDELRKLNLAWESFQRAHIPERLLPEWMKGKPVNLGSGDHVAWVLYKVLGCPEIKNKKGTPQRNKATPRWPTGKPLANDKALAKLKLTTDEQRDFLRIRKEIARVRAELSKTLYFFRGVVKDYGGRFYGQYNQNVTATHRLSSSGRKLRMADGKDRGVQLQNMPRKFKGLLLNDVSCDCAQLEFRVAVELGDDDVGRQQIRDGVDRHKVTAAAMFGVEYDDVTKEQRQAAKPETFKPLYGGRKGTPQQEAYYAAFRKMFPGIAATQEGWTETVLQTGQLTLPWGMTFYWPGTGMGWDGYIENTPSIYNYPIQSLATAEIVPIGTVYLWHRLKHQCGGLIKIVNLVHDSVDARLTTADEKQAWADTAVEAFGQDVYNYLYQVYGMEWETPLALGVVIDGKETTYTLDNVCAPVR